MDNNTIAKELARLGKREARLTAKLVAVQGERCQLLQGVASEASLDPDVVALTVAPKEDES